MSSLDIAIIALYFLGVLAVGFHASRRIHGLGDFVVAGRTLTAPILVGSLVATYYGLDVSLLALLIAGRVRESRALTLPDYFMARFGRGILLPTSVVTFSYSLPVMSVFGFGVLGEYLFGLPLVWGCWRADCSRPSMPPPAGCWPTPSPTSCSSC